MHVTAAASEQVVDGGCGIEERLLAVVADGAWKDVEGNDALKTPHVDDGNRDSRSEVKAAISEGRWAETVTCANFTPPGTSESEIG